MPWKVRKAPSGGFDIVRADTGKKVGHSTTKKKAQASVRARYANTTDDGHSTVYRKAKKISGRH